MANQPEWLDESPEWFQKFYNNHFVHFSRDIWWTKWIALGTLAAIITAAVAKLI